MESRDVAYLSSLEAGVWYDLFKEAVAVCCLLWDDESWRVRQACVGREDLDLFEVLSRGKESRDRRERRTLLRRNLICPDCLKRT